MAWITIPTWSLLAAMSRSVSPKIALGWNTNSSVSFSHPNQFRVGASW